MAQSQTDRNGAGTTPPTTPAGLQAAIDASAASATASAASATAAATSATASATSAADAAAQLATKASLAGATFTGGVNLARSSIVQHATTMNLWALSNTIDGTGSALVVTAIANAPQAGAIRRYYGLANTVWTNNAMFAVDGNANFTFFTGDYIDIEAVTTSTYKVHPFKADGTSVVIKQIQLVNATVAANALTLTSNATSFDFRSSALTSGTVSTRTIPAPISLVVPSTATLGTVNAVVSRLLLLAIDNAGTVELAITNLAGGLQLDETNLISTTAISAAATSASVIYSTTARTNVAYRVVGFIDITEATAGTWATASSQIQGIGGQALASLSSIGYGQIVRDVTASRSTGTVFTNTTGKPITFTVVCNIGAGGTVIAQVNTGSGFTTVNYSSQSSAGTDTRSVSGLVPVGAQYRNGGNTAITLWTEIS